jgi:hypothetical protein
MGLFLIVTLFAAPFVQGAEAQADPYIGSVRERFAADTWRLGEVRDGFELGTLELPELRGAPPRCKGLTVQRSFHLAGVPPSASAALLLESLVLDDSAIAHAQLVRWLSTVSSPASAVESSAYGARIGQACYVGPSGAGPRAVSWVAFVEGNVAVRLWNLDLRTYPALDLIGFAAVIDARIAERPRLGPGKPVPRPEIERLAADSANAVAGTPVKLDVSVVDPRHGTPVLAWNVGGAGQGYVERRNDDWYLFPTGPGTLTVELTVVGTTATVATAELQLDIADD